MSNLSDLLPTGGGQNAVDFVASGTLSSGQTVVLKADGTVEAVAISPASLGSSSVMQSGNTVTPVAVYDSVNNKVVVNYAGPSNYGRAVVGTISGTTITFGTPVIYRSATCLRQSAAFDSGAGKVLLCYSDYSASRSGKAVVGTVSGTSISFGAIATFDAGDSNYISATYDSTAQKTIIAYRNASGSGSAGVATISGTSVSFGSFYNFGNLVSSFISASYNSVVNKTLISYRDEINGDYLTSIVATLSGTVLSYGTPVVMASQASWSIGSCEISGSSKNVVVFKDRYSPNLSRVVVATISGTSISAGAITSTGIGLSNEPSIPVTYDSSSEKVIIFGRNQLNNYAPTYIVGSITGTTVALETPVVVQSVESYETAVIYTTGNKSALIWNTLGYDNSVGAVFSAESSNRTDFIGITAEAISSGATGPVNVYGGINEAQSGLTIGSNYYVQADGSISTTVSDVLIGQAISTTTINIRDLT